MGMDSKSIVGRDPVTCPAIYCFDDQNVSIHNNLNRRLVALRRGDNRADCGPYEIGKIASNGKAS